MDINLVSIENIEPNGEGYDITTPFGVVNIGFEHCPGFEETLEHCCISIYPYESKGTEESATIESYVQELFEIEDWDRGSHGLLECFVSLEIGEVLRQKLKSRDDVKEVGCRSV